MDNANKALIMAGSTLVAVMLFTLFVVFLNNVSIWPEAQDQMLNTEQVATFNAEYEVYQKSAMYGVDVISCLNKAKSNNEKYVEGDYFLGDGAHGKLYEINVTIKITKPLTESISVTAMKYMSLSNTYRETTIHEDSDRIIENFNKIELYLKDVFDIDETKQLTKFNKDEYLRYEMDKSDSGLEINTVYELTEPGDDNKLKKLLAHSNEPRQIVKNKEKPNSNYVYDPTSNLFGWCTATWNTYLYSFKQKRFKCENIEFSPRTGRINKIDFVEI